ncbi:MAG: hypothetical protein ACOYMW_12975 [Candidatus Competibacteraceae bacterium]
MLMSGPDYRKSLRRYQPQLCPYKATEAVKLARGLLSDETGPKLHGQPGCCCAMGYQMPPAPSAVGSTLIPN